MAPSLRHICYCGGGSLRKRRFYKQAFFRTSWRVRRQPIPEAKGKSYACSLEDGTPQHGDFLHLRLGTRPRPDFPRLPIIRRAGRRRGRHRGQASKRSAATCPFRAPARSQPGFFTRTKFPRPPGNKVFVRHHRSSPGGGSAPPRQPSRKPRRSAAAKTPAQSDNHSPPPGGAAGARPLHFRRESARAPPMMNRENSEILADILRADKPPREKKNAASSPRKHPVQKLAQKYSENRRSRVPSWWRAATAAFRALVEGLPPPALKPARLWRTAIVGYLGQAHQALAF